MGPMSPLWAQCAKYAHFVPNRPIMGPICPICLLWGKSAHPWAQYAHPWAQYAHPWAQYAHKSSYLKSRNIYAMVNYCEGIFEKKANYTHKFAYITVP